MDKIPQEILLNNLSFITVKTFLFNFPQYQEKEDIIQKDVGRLLQNIVCFIQPENFDIVSTFAIIRRYLSNYNKDISYQFFPVPLIYLSLYTHICMYYDHCMYKLTWEKTTGECWNNFVSNSSKLWQTLDYQCQTNEAEIKLAFEILKDKKYTEKIVRQYHWITIKRQLDRNLVKNESGVNKFLGLKGMPHN